MSTFNEFQRELQRRNIDPANAYMFTMIYERLIDTTQQLYDMSQALVAMADQMQGFLTLHEETQKRIKRIERAGRPDGIEIWSEPGRGDG